MQDIGRKTKRILGMPYNFSRPSWKKITQNMWQPNGPMLVPKSFGIGWTINLGHNGTKILVAIMLCMGIAAIVSR